MQDTTCSECTLFINNNVQHRYAQLIEVQQICSILLTTMNNVGSKTLFHLIKPCIHFSRGKYNLDFKCLFSL